MILSTLIISTCSALATPSAQQLGEILGYPANEIVIEQITDEERALWATPSARERGQGVAMPDAQALIAAYRITARNPSTFFPMLIWIGSEGAFLNAKTKKTLDLIASDEAKPVIKGGRGPFGPLSFEGLGEGGIYLGKVKVGSENKQMQEPQEKAAMISILHLTYQRKDLRIAFMASLKGGTDLSAISGGERYFESFHPAGSIEPRYDVEKLFLSLNQLITTESEVNTPAPASLTRASDNNDSMSTPAQAKTANFEVATIAQQSPELAFTWAWLTLVGLMIGALIFFKKRR
ncbi:MAG: hypothetical protein CFE26_04115 [Verrucomicrobiales bacterium VVV1]|nr:MAG: hypothetical protein CFE26_04115 [Verrucomicrobiales bacterium VVV1]